MESESSFIARQLRYFSATLYAQIKLSTRDGQNDLAKMQEVSLLNLINMACNRKFIDLNQIQRNFAALDYGDYTANMGLQMTATVTKQKFTTTIKKINNEPTLKKAFPNVWFFLLTVEPVNDSVKFYSDDVKITYVTLFDMVSEVLKMDMSFQRQFLQAVKEEYTRYFSLESEVGNRYLYSDLTPLPQDLLLFNDLIRTGDWYDLNLGDGYIEVRKVIENFREKLSNCPVSARGILFSSLKSASYHSSWRDKLCVYVDKIYGRLDINQDNYAEFKHNLNYLINNELIEIWDEYTEPYEEGDEAYLKNRPKFLLNYNISEPEMNLYAALIVFYTKYHDNSKLEQAFLYNDFSLLSDSCCHQ